MAAPIPAMERVFAEMASRVRKRRVIYGISSAALMIIGLASAGVILDIVLQLPQLMRCLLFILWLYYSVLIVRRNVMVPLRETIPPETLAGLIESRYPAFSERLLTLASDPSGSKLLIAQLGKETHRRASSVVPAEAVPERPIGWFSVLSGLIVAVILVSIPFIPGAAERTRRFVIPWYEPGLPVNFRLIVTSGSPVVKRGEAVSLSAVLERIKPNVEYPERIVATVVENGKSIALPMTGDSRGAYVVTKPNVQSDFVYTINVGGTQSEKNTILVSDSVELTDASSMTISPPAYATAIAPARTIPGFGEIETVQYSTIHFLFAFDRNPEAVGLEFSSADGTSRGIPLEPVTKGVNGYSARASITVQSSGTLKLTLTGERGIQSTAKAALKVVPDLPPRFATVVGLSTRAMEIRPGEKLPLSIGVTDDFAVSSLVLEYRVGRSSSAVTTVPIPVTGLGTAVAESKYRFDTTGKCAAGETLFLRLRARDNRLLPDRQLAPNETLFPGNDWLPLTVTASARPLAEQHIFGQRDAITEHLKLASAKLNEAKSEIQAVSNHSRQRLTDDLLTRLKLARERSSEAITALEELAREASLIPELVSLAEDARSLTTGPIKSSMESTKRAELQPPRPNSMWPTVTTEAIRQIDKLLARNEQLANQRLDKRILDALAAEQNELANKAKTAKPGPETAELAARQRELKQRLDAVVREREGLRNAADEQSKKNAADLARDAAALRKDYETNERNRNDAERKALEARNAELADKQAALAREAAALAGKVKASTPASGVKPPNTAAAQSSAEKFASGDPLGAMAEQESAARELDHAASEIERAAAARKDPKEAARQIAKWQADYAARMDEATKRQTLDKLPRHVRDALVAEAEAIQKAVASIDVPPSLNAKKTDAVDKATQAAKQVSRGDLAGVALREATKATAGLADKMPSRKERMQLARSEVNKRLDEQANLTRDVQETVKTVRDQAQLAAKLSVLAERQRAISDTTAKMDTPGLEARKSRAIDASKKADADLSAGRVPDLTASQAEVRRQLDRLKQAIEGNETVEEIVNRLSRQQRQIADSASQLKPDSPAADVERINELERELNRELSGLSIPESPALTNQAKDAARAAESASRRPMNRNPDVDELKKKTKSAADTLDQLADRATATESDAARVERLMKNRERAADRARQLIGKPVNPEAHAEAIREAQSDVDELNQTRTGEAGKEKAKALAKLSKLVQLPDPDRQAELQKQAAEALGELLKAMKPDGERNATKPRPASAAPPDFNAQTAPGLPTQDAAEAAKALAAKQRSARDDASRAAAAGASQGAMGESLRQKEAALAKRISELAERSKRESQASGLTRTETGQQIAESMGKASEAIGEAAAQAARAVRETKEGRPNSAAMARNEVKSQLDRAVSSLADAPKPTDAKANEARQPDTGRASGEMANAERKLTAGDAPGAATSARSAADAISPPPSSTNPAANPAANPARSDAQSSTITADKLPQDLKKYAGVPWGELPGDVKGKIINDLRAQYGEEYATVIKLYFEQLAEGKTP
ncbi:MAG: hypothetical protein U0798_21045 [Gemmataceae bacterium]